MRRVFLLVIVGLPLLAGAAEHGPVFGLATPTNSKGEWNFDEGVFTHTLATSAHKHQCGSWSAMVSRRT